MVVYNLREKMLTSRFSHGVIYKAGLNNNIVKAKIMKINKMKKKIL